MVNNRHSAPGRCGSSESLTAEIAHALETEPALLPVLPWLLQDLPTLSGRFNDDILALLHRAGLPRGASVLDLGCGRGEIALAVADVFDARVTGVDALEAFVEHAERAAAERGLARRCRFRCCDLRAALADEERHDAVLLIAVGPILGGLAPTVAALRRVVRAGGLILIDDAYLSDGAEPPPGYEDYLDRARTEQALTEHGDAIVAALARTAAMASYNDLALASIRRRAATLARSRPALAEELHAYVERQARETELMKGVVVPAAWVLRKGGKL